MVLKKVKGAQPSTKKTTKLGISVPIQELLGTADIQEAPYNPRIMPKDRMASLKASLAKHGMILNLVVQKRSKQYKQNNVLIGGHQRLRALREIANERGIEPPTKLPCVVLDVDDATAKQLNVALNRIEGEFDHFKVGEMFSDIIKEMTTDDVLATGFDALQIEQMVALTLPIEEQVIDTSQAWEGMPDCDSEDQTAWGSVKVNFANEEDMKAFAKLMRQPVHKTTRSIWYPKAKIGHIANKSYETRSA